MFKGYKNHLLAMDKTNKSVSLLDHVNKCSKCKRLNPSLYSSVLNNVQNCLFCGNPFYIIKLNK
jgi:hypothetical protein